MLQFDPLFDFIGNLVEMLCVLLKYMYRTLTSLAFQTLKLKVKTQKENSENINVIL